MPKISVCALLDAEHARHIPAMLESIVNQTESDFEFLILNNAPTEEHIKEMVASCADQRIVYRESEAALDIAEARNALLDAARGEYVALCDAGSVSAPERLAKQAAYLDTHPHIGVVGCLVASPSDRDAGLVSRYPAGNDKIKRALIAGGRVIAHCAAMVRRSVLTESGARYEQRFAPAEAYGLWCRLIEHSAFANIPEVLARRHADAARASRARRKTTADAVERAGEAVREKYLSRSRTSWRDTLRLVLMRPFVSRTARREKRLRYAAPEYPQIRNPKLIMTLLVRDEADIVEKNLLYHRAMGVDGFIATDNASADGTRDILLRYKDKGWILELIDEPAQHYAQAEWVHRMAALARKKHGADWIINADADEFWHARSGSLKTACSASRGNMLFVPLYNMLDEGGDWLDNVRRVTARLPEAVEQGLIQSGMLSRYSQFGRQVPKVIVRASEYVHIHKGNHDAEMVLRHRPYTAHDMLIYHFSSRGRDNFARKMLVKGAALERNARVKANASVHVRYFWNGYKAGTMDMDDEYDKFVGTLCMDAVMPLLVRDETIRRFFCGPAEKN